MKNNIFRYATGELSQDAFICWSVNWINDKTSSLFPMAAELLQLFGVNMNEVADDLELEIFQQKFKIDVLLSLKRKNKMIIIEDKTYSSEHHDQIDKYRNKIIHLSENERKEFGIDENVEITTVYFKTGFFYDCDKRVKADVVIDGKQVLTIIEKYQQESEILDNYCEHLRESLDWYTVYGQYDYIGEQENFWEWNISKFQIAQYRMMRDIFPEHEWDKTSSLYEVRHGSNVGGRPWTELDIMIGKIGKENGEYHVFWRIDTDSEGPYLSLRFYDKYNKEDQQEHQEHVAVYQKHRNQLEKIVVEENMIDWKWDAIRGGFTANYFEATLLTFYLKDVLKNWDAESAKVIQTVRKITECFVAVNGFVPN